LVGVQVDSAVEFRGRGVILHNDHSLTVPRGTEVNTIGYAGRSRSPPDLPMIHKNHQGLTGSIKIAAGNSHRACQLTGCENLDIMFTGSAPVQVAVAELWTLGHEAL
jgi:hypothetical protein